MGVYTDKFRELIATHPEYIEYNNSKITATHIQKLFIYYDTYVRTINEFILFTTTTFDKNIKKDHQAKLQYDEIIQDISIIVGSTSSSINLLETLLFKYSSPNIEKTDILNAYYDYRVLNIYNCIIDQIHKSLQLLIKKIGDFGTNLFATKPKISSSIIN